MNISHLFIYLYVCFICFMLIQFHKWFWWIFEFPAVIITRLIIIPALFIMKSHKICMEPVIPNLSLPKLHKLWFHFYNPSLTTYLLKFIFSNSSRPISNNFRAIYHFWIKKHFRVFHGSHILNRLFLLTNFTFSIEKHFFHEKLKLALTYLKLIKNWI